MIGDQYCKVRQIRDDKVNLNEAGPAMAVEVVGVGKEQPRSGDVFFGLETE